MIIIAGSSYVDLAQRVALELGASLIVADTQRFEDQELRIQISADLRGHDVVILQSTSKPANDHLMELLLLADTAKRAGCESITAIIPYFGYGRQDRPAYTYGPVSAALVARLIEDTGISRVITVNLHSKQSEGFFKMYVQNLDPLPLFISCIKGGVNCAVVSPDVGGLSRARALAERLDAELVVINKNRKITGECVVTNIIGNVRDKNCIIIDDIIDTGGTLCKSAALLREYSAKSICACVTHGVFSGQCIQMIEEAKFDQFFVTDTIKQQTLPDCIKLISISKFIADALRNSVTY